MIPRAGAAQWQATHAIRQVIVPAVWQIRGSFRETRKILREHPHFVQQNQNAAPGPLMGVVMAEGRGSVDGKVVSEILRKELEKVIAKK